MRRLRARLAAIESDYDAGDIDGRRFKIATEKVQSELDSAVREQARHATGSGAASLLLSGDPVAAFDASPLMIRRTVVDALCEVRIGRAPRGKKGFDPESVRIVWRTS